MRLNTTLLQVQKLTSRYQLVYAAARARQPALQPFATAAQAIAFVSDQAASADDRAPCVEAFVAEHRCSASPLWQVLLLSAFAPMLLSLRGSLGGPESEYLDSQIVLAFLEALRAHNFSGAKPFVSIHRATLNALRALRRREQSIGRVSVDGDVPETLTYGVEDDLERRRILEILNNLPALDDGLRDLAEATIVGDESLTEYVERLHPDLDKHAFHATYERLRLARVEIAKELYERLTGAPVPETPETPSHIALPLPVTIERRTPCLRRNNPRKQRRPLGFRSRIGRRPSSSIKRGKASTS